MCGLAPRRTALDGTEMRACWTGMPRGVDSAGRPWAAVDVADERVAVGAVAPGWEPRRPRTFVPIDDLEAPGPEVAEGIAVAEATLISPVTRVPGTWWLWGDPEPWPE